MAGGERDQNRSAGGYRFLGLGMELAAAVAGLTLVGVWADRHFGTSPWGVLIGVATGVVGGLYNAVKAVIVSSRPDDGPEPVKSAEPAEDEKPAEAAPGSEDSGS